MRPDQIVQDNLQDNYIPRVTIESLLNPLALDGDDEPFDDEAISSDSDPESGDVGDIVSVPGMDRLALDEDVDCDEQSQSDERDDSIAKILPPVLSQQGFKWKHDSIDFPTPEEDVPTVQLLATGLG